MTSLIAAAAFFVLLHLLVSGTRLRSAIVGTIGEGTYMALFSLASLGGIVWLSMAYGDARGFGETWWDTGAAGRHTALIIQLIAFLLIIPGLLTPNPTSVKQEGSLDRPDVARGMLRITRHPFLWGVAIWAIGHLLVNGDAPSALLFGSLLALAIFGTFSIDAKRRKALGPKWEPFATMTSNVPFGAIISRKQKLSLSEIGWWRILLAVAIWAAVLLGHRYAFGVDPLA
ncbi:MAG TPA: NnrU family protein [Caulobacteraceae bacterium]|nr:NnrU family protein [Caulobacteraceae bacterium]